MKPDSDRGKSARKAPAFSPINLDEEKLKFKLEERTCETGTDFQKRMHNRKLMKGTMGLTQMREWKRTKEDPAAKAATAPGSAPVVPSKRKADLSSKQVDQFLRDKKLELQRTECEMSKRRRFMEQYKAELVLKKMLPNEDVSLDELFMPKEKIREIELQISYQDRFKLDEFYAFLLSLDIYNLLTRETLPAIPTAFEDGLAYKQTFRSIFLHEVRADIEMCVRHADISNPPKVMLRANHEANEFIYLICAQNTRDHRVNLATHFRQDELVLCVLDNGEKLPPRINTTCKFKSQYFLSICELESADNKIKSAFYLKTRITDEVRAIAKTPRTYYVIFLEYTKTMIREFRMINTANFLELPMLVNSKAPELYPVPPRVTNVSIFVPPLNPAQVDALSAALSPKPEFILISGPPATGKTHVLMCLLSLYLQRQDCPKPILVCAPTETAVDELVARAVRDGITGFNGNARTDLKLIRVGTREKDLLEFKQRIPCERPQLKGDEFQMCLQHIVRQRMGDQGIVRDMNRLDNLGKRLEQVEDQVSRTSESADPGQWHRLQTERRETITALNKEKSDRAMFENKKKTAEMESLKFADIIFTTLSNAASRCMERANRDARIVLIDEATGAVELTTLVPLLYHAQKVVMFGDPMGLPPLVFSELAIRAGYRRSLFERLEARGFTVCNLKEQYRMSPEIREFPSAAFYGGTLVDANHTRKLPGWNPAPPLLFVNIKSSSELRDEWGFAVSNPQEVIFIVDLYAHYSVLQGCGMNIGVIAPSKKQVEAIKAALTARHSNRWTKDIEVNTTEGFQGREKDVIIISAGRTKDEIGGLCEARRLNIAMTRAKWAVWVLGRVDTLKKLKPWEQLITHCCEKGVVVEADTFADVQGVLGPVDIKVKFCKEES